MSDFKAENLFAFARKLHDLILQEADPRGIGSCLISAGIGVMLNEGATPEYVRELVESILTLDQSAIDPRRTTTGGDA